MHLRSLHLQLCSTETLQLPMRINVWRHTGLLDHLSRGERIGSSTRNGYSNISPPTMWRELKNSEQFCSAETYQVIHNLVAPDKPAARTFMQLVELVKNYYFPPPSVIAQRFAFNKRTQKEGETTSDFVADLRRLLEHYQYGNSLNDMLRDCLVCGVRDRRLQQRLLSEPDLTFKKAFDLCQASEQADKNAKELQGGTSRAKALELVFWLYEQTLVHGNR